MVTHNCDAQELLDASKCFACLTPGQLQVLAIVLLCKSIYPTMASCDPQELLDASKCFECLTPGQLAVIQTQLLCELVNAGGASGETCLYCGTDDPVDDPTCECALYYRTDTMGVWLWDMGTTTWKQLAGGP